MIFVVPPSSSLQYIQTSPPQHYMVAPHPPPHAHIPSGHGHVHLVSTQHARHDPLQRKRPKYTRSKTGCLTCRTKKIKVSTEQSNRHGNKFAYDNIPPAVRRDETDLPALLAWCSRCPLSLFCSVFWYEFFYSPFFDSARGRSLPHQRRKHQPERARRGGRPPQNLFRIFLTPRRSPAILRLQARSAAFHPQMAVARQNDDTGKLLAISPAKIITANRMGLFVLY